MIKFKGKAEEMRIASSCLDFRALSVKEEKEKKRSRRRRRRRIRELKESFIIISTQV